VSQPPGPSRVVFDLWSTFYDLPLVQRLTYRPIHDVVLALLAERPPRRVLDLGCGTGLLAARLRRSLPNARIVGCDFSTGMLAHARARDGTGDWVRGDAQRLPFRSGAFDAIVSSEAFHWFPDQSAALAECARVLAPEGRLLVALVNTLAEPVSAAVHLGSRLLGQPFYWPTRARMRQLVQSAGLRVERQERIARLPGGILFPPVLTVASRPAG
jgi:ubiquinone/menaquinone biosynthesis C-methylase UbiE